MRFVFLVEGHTERKCLPDFTKRWLDARLPARVGVTVVRHDGWGELLRDLPTKVPLHLKKDDVIAVVALLDLYGPTIYPAGMNAVQRRDWGRKHYEALISNPRFRLYFAMHETEAWILSNPDLLPEKVRRGLPGKAKQPETVNFDEPPSKLLMRLYREKHHTPYRKLIDGADLFKRLDPDRVHKLCPSFEEMMDELLALAVAKGAA